MGFSFILRINIILFTSYGEVYTSKIIITVSPEIKAQNDGK